ncbi:MAG: hypothetical protein ACOZAR_03840 [Patescibacteria group bacterium]
MNEANITKNSDDSLEIVSATVNNEGEEYWLAGEVKNISGARLDYVGVVVAVKDCDGQVINCDQIYLLGNSYLQSGETGYFKYHFSAAMFGRMSGLKVVVSPFYQKLE